MLFMSIATYPPERRNEVVKRRAEKGMTTPEGLKIINQWVDISGGRVFTLAEANDTAALLEWNFGYSDLSSTELVPVMESEDVMKLIQRSS